MSGAGWLDDMGVPVNSASLLPRLPDFLHMVPQKSNTRFPHPANFHCMSLKTNITITICLNTNRFGEDFSVYSFQQLCFHIIFGGLLVYGFNRFQI
jgi:hypothetical protein